MIRRIIDRLKGKKSYSDKERLDFVEKCIMNAGKISARRDHNPNVDSESFGDLPTMQLFTVPSQHVRETGLRNTIDLAINTAKEINAAKPEYFMGIYG